MYKTNPVVSITNKCNSAIVPFAQREMVDSFISGVSNEYNEIIGNSLRELVKQYTKIILDNIEEIDEKDKPEYTKSINNDVDNILKGIFDRVNDFRRSHYVNPILDAVNVLPKDELAAMAENLVNLTSFKRKISMEAETVGGAIDVAVISKGDGFVWINRKHYFDIKKNPHFVNNYFNKRGE